MHRYMRWTLALTLLGVAVPASAQTSIGLRAGVSADPDQFFFGGHVETDPLAEHVTLRPNIEVGVGDHVTAVAANVELVYAVPLDRHPGRVYFGGGPALVVYSFDRGRGSDSDVGGGFNVLVGFQHDGGLFGELKVGAVDSPDFKFTVGYVLP